MLCVWMLRMEREHFYVSTLLCFNCLIGMREDQVSCACGCGGLKENTIIIYFQLNWNERGSSPLCL